MTMIIVTTFVYYCFFFLFVLLSLLRGAAFAASAALYSLALSFRAVHGFRRFCRVLFWGVLGVWGFQEYKGSFRRVWRVWFWGGLGFRSGFGGSNG